MKDKASWLKKPGNREKQRAYDRTGYASADAHELQRERWRLNKRAQRARKKAEREAAEADRHQGRGVDVEGLG